MSLAEGLAGERAWEVRRAGFPPVIRFARPTRTGVVSTTGGHCKLNCAHCGGRYLRGMLSPAEALRRARTAGAPASWLVSGGCDHRGRVPMPLGLLQELGRSARLVLHVGLLDLHRAEEVATAAAVVAFDVVGDRETAREVMGLDVGVEDYLDVYRALARHTRVVPHICLGLSGGRIRGELAALEALAGECPQEIVFLVFSPTPGTVYAGHQPPPLAAVGSVLGLARRLFPTTPLTLGCMRPGGHYRQALDELAVKLGMNGIAVPSPAAGRAAGERGLEIIQGEECCVLH
ncbi:MAG: radical SAM protein [bacterium]|nr:radical SAM protein [bacterium]